MQRAESYRRVAYPGCDALCMVFATLDTDYNEFRGKPQLELPQLREYMNAVNSPIGPEIEQHNLPAEISELQCFASGVNPVDIVRKFRGPY